DSITLKEHEFSIDKIDVKSPRISAQRDADGSLLAAGFRLTPAPAAPPPPPDDALQSLYQPHQIPTTLPTTTPTTAPSSPAEPSSVATLGRLIIRDASVRWTDRALQPPPPVH